jgi:hypothetical protein
MKDGIIVEYAGSSAAVSGNGPGDLRTWEPRFLDDAEGNATDVPNEAWRGAHYGVLDRCEQLGNIVFLLCVAFEDNYDFQDGNVVHTGELRVLPSNMVSMIQRMDEQGPSSPLPNRAHRRANGGRGIIL